MRCPGGLLVGLALPGETELDDVLALYEGIAEAGVPVVGGDTTASPVVVDQRHRARAERARTGPRRRASPATRSSSPARSAVPAPRSEPAAIVRPPLRLDEGRELARSAHAQMDISDGLAVDLGHIARRSGVRCVVELERVPLADGATVDDLGFGEDFELLAAVPEPGRFAAIGRVEEGEGVELLLDGEPYALAGWEHFATGV